VKLDDTFIGIEIGGTKLQLAAGDGTGRILQRCRLAVDQISGAAGIREQIEQALPELLTRHNPVGIGAGFGGPVDHTSGRICTSHQINGWDEFPLADWLHSLSGCKAAVDNDANVAALGEAVAGAGRRRNPVFYVTLGSGVGGGLVVDGRIYYGTKPGEAELGHVCLDRTGTTVESRCSGWAIDRRIREARAGNPESILTRLAGAETGNESRFLGASLAQGDALAQTIVCEIAEELGFALSHVAHLFHPEIIVLGGGLSLTGEPLRSAVEKAMPRFIMKSFLPGPQIALAGLGEDAVTAGALVMAGTTAISQS